MTNINSSLVYKRDDTAAFGGILVRIYIHPDEPGVIITKAAVSINYGKGFGADSITKEYENPTFPLDINLDREETQKLQPVNELYLACWDQYGLKKTATGHLTFTAEGQKVKG